MARYTAKKKQEEFSELGNGIILAMLIISMSAEKPRAALVGEGDKLWVPGRSICKFIGGKWTNYRHKAAMVLVGHKCLEAWKGYERGSDKKELWRYSLTEQASVYWRDLAARATKDCIHFNPAQLALFEMNHDVK